MYYWQFWVEYYRYLSNLALAAHPSPTTSPSAGLVGNDSSEAISSREKYEYLSEYGTQILCMLHAKKGCTYLSKNFQTITGNDVENANGQKFFTLIQPDYRERLQELLVFEKNETAPHTLHCKIKHQEDSWQWYMLTIHPAAQENAGCVCILENIHENVQAQSTLQKAKLEAELALSARSEFLANMSHDLRTPLNAVIGFAQIIESEMFGKVNSQYLEYAKHIQESGYDLLSKIEDLLEIASIDAGRIRLDRQDVYLNDILKHAIAAQAHHAATAEVLVEYAPPARGNILLHADRVKLQHIIGHLLANAVKFSHRGGKVTVEADINQDGQFVLRISDHGIGINNSKLSEITEALQEDNCWSIGSNSSVGLGLALTREFINLHGGKVSIFSATGDGTTVEIVLPEDCVRFAKDHLPLYAQVAG